MVLDACWHLRKSMQSQLDNFKKRNCSLRHGLWEHGKTDVIYVDCTNEFDLLTKFIKYWRTSNFDVITGWNVNSFDITYLCNRIDRIIGEGEHKKLSYGNQTNVREFTAMGYQKQQVYDIVGINGSDYLEIYRKKTFVNQESYRLEHIAQVELGKGKLDYSEYGSLHTLYKQDYAKVFRIQWRDVVLVEELDDKLGFMELVMSQAYTKM